ncbi:PP2C family protein-serine/threonine phosphatase [Lunatibacter salilacus]|uniref:PP2C family protein-serine/threonine phosphatase n=1 Tax=Lunatibacter salilacus TaxID=2483804 RepID=UPI00131C63C4|nr:protein phosphatase 2C domain-containing protein [Lunatibacter salilacus]
MSYEINLYPPQCFSGIGKKETNEDYIIPSDNSAVCDRNAFFCCDGVGGSPFGEIASKIVCESMEEFFQTNPNIIHNESVMNVAVRYAREKLRDYENNHPETRGMKTTMTAVCFHQDGATLAWMGDSRIYQVRDGKILYQTWDHSYVNTLVEQGLLSLDKRRTHPKRNSITRTLSTAKSDRIPEVKMIKDIKVNDYFLLCTDGLLEQERDKHIECWLSESEKLEQIKGIILNHCRDKTQDNFSMILVKIKSINRRFSS